MGLLMPMSMPAPVGRVCTWSMTTLWLRLIGSRLAVCWRIGMTLLSMSGTGGKCGWGSTRLIRRADPGSWRRDAGC